jgi:hypothetical protein
MNIALEKIIDSLKNKPSEWVHKNNGAHTLEHKSGVSVWLDNIPILCTNTYAPYPLSIGLFDKYRLYQATKNVTDSRIIELLG